MLYMDRQELKDLAEELSKEGKNLPKAMVAMLEHIEALSKDNAILHKRINLLQELVENLQIRLKFSLDQ